MQENCDESTKCSGAKKDLLTKDKQFLKNAPIYSIIDKIGKLGADFGRKERLCNREDS